MTRIATILFAALMTCLPAFAQAPAANSYNVEVVVFRAAGGVGASEYWGVAPTRNLGTDEETAPGSAQVGRFVRAIPPAQFQLTDVANKLRSSGVYTPVAHVAWSQTASDWGTRAGFNLQRLGMNVPGLSGTVFLERGQYLHLGMTLTYAPEGTTFSLNETRRIKFYERNYYDHPAFGVIALVTPAQGARPAGR
jgi:hypothetical protein